MAVDGLAGSGNRHAAMHARRNHHQAGAGQLLNQHVRADRSDPKRTAQLDAGWRLTEGAPVGRDGLQGGPLSVAGVWGLFAGHVFLAGPLPGLRLLWVSRSGRAGSRGAFWKRPKLEGLRKRREPRSLFLALHVSILNV